MLSDEKNQVRLQASDAEIAKLKAKGTRRDFGDVGGCPV